MCLFLLEVPEQYSVCSLQKSMMSLQPSGVSVCAAHMHTKIGKKPVKEGVGKATTQFPEKEKQAMALIQSVPAIQ